jgi:anti-sigma factor RsiW
MTLACSRHQNNFSALIDEQLDFNSKFEIQQHLNDCAECSSEMVKWRDFEVILEESLHEVEGEIPDLWSSLADRLPSVCELIEEEMSAYLDEELSGAAQDGVNNHIATCSDCRHKFELLEETNERLRAVLLEPVELKVNLWDSIKSQLNANCTLISAELSPFVDQEVTNDRHRSISQHLMECTNCSNALQQLTALGDFLKENHVHIVPDDLDILPGLRNRLRNIPQVQEEKRVPNRKPLLIGALGVVAALAVFGIAASLFLLSLHGDTRMVSSEDYLIDYALSEPSKKIEAIVSDDTN